MNYIGSLWPQSGEAGLEDLEAILSAPTPKLDVLDSRASCTGGEVEMPLLVAPPAAPAQNGSTEQAPEQPLPLLGHTAAATGQGDGREEAPGQARTGATGSAAGVRRRKEPTRAGGAEQACAGAGTAACPGGSDAVEGDTRGSPGAGAEKGSKGDAGEAAPEQAPPLWSPGRWLPGSGGGHFPRLRPAPESAGKSGGLGGRHWVPALGGLGLGLGGVEATTVAATLLGAAAGGAVAGPWGVTAGAKSGAVIVAAGASVCGTAHHCYLHGWPGRVGGPPAPPAGAPTAVPHMATPAAPLPPVMRPGAQAAPSAPGLGWDLGAGRAAAAMAASAAAATASASASVMGLWRGAELAHAPGRAPCTAAHSESGSGRRSGRSTGTADAATAPGSAAAGSAAHGDAGLPAGAGGAGGAAHAAVSSAVQPGSAAAESSGQGAVAAGGAAVPYADSGHVCAAHAKGDAPAAPACAGSSAAPGAAAGDLEPMWLCRAGRDASAGSLAAPGALAAEGADVLAAGSAELPVSTVPPEPQQGQGRACSAERHAT